MSFLYKIKTCFPKNNYTQTQLVDFLKNQWKDHPTRLRQLDRFHKNTQVGSRNLALSLEEYQKLDGFKDKNSAFIDVALNLVEETCTQLFEESKIKPEDISMIISNSITGLSVPSLEAKLMNKLPFKKNTKRMPIFGLGCLAGVAGINRAMDYLQGHPKEAVLFFSVELCSLTFQLDDLSVANLVSTGLFGDGCSACLLVGKEHPLASESSLEWIGGQSEFFSDTERVMGWDFVDTGLKIVLSKDVADIVKEKMPSFVIDTLSRLKLEAKDIQTIMAHPGGPKVLEALEDVICELNPTLQDKDCLYQSWDDLNLNGNMSSVSVLSIIDRTLQNLNQPSKELKNKNQEHYALMTALGPAFCAEIGIFKCL